ncbi:MAG: hypothetical protein ACRDDX_15205 [Cellulosilyticaceae bacterium]
MRNLTWIGHEMRLQLKNGMYLLYVGVACFYILSMSYIPVDYKPLALSLIIFSDPTFLGMFFVGSLFLLEKEQGIPKAIGVSPLGISRYLLGKIVSLLVISVFASVGIIIASGFTEVGWVQLVVGILLSGSLFTLGGMILATMVRNINQFLIIIGGGCMVLALPLMAYYGIWEVQLFNWIPTYSAMALIDGGMRKSGSLQDVVHSIYLLLWNVVTLKVTIKMIEEKVFRG